MGKENEAKKSSFQFSELKSEFHKIVWPSRQQLGKQSVAVIIAAVVLGCIISAVDWVMQVGLSFIIG